MSYELKGVCMKGIRVVRVEREIKGIYELKGVQEYGVDTVLRKT